MKWELTQACGQCLYTVVVGDSQRTKCAQRRLLAHRAGTHYSDMGLHNLFTQHLMYFDAG